MHGRNYREHKPLVSMQLRLRNLIKITGINLDCDNNNAVYFTLHFSAFSKPFYTSKSVEIKNNKAEWPEINCEQYRNSSHRFICIRVWRKLKLISEYSAENDNNMLFLWGVYFSGLVILNSYNETTKFKSNTLIFHLDGGVFTSSEKINYQQQQNHINNETNNENQYFNIIPLVKDKGMHNTLQKQQQDCDKIEKNIDNNNIAKNLCFNDYSQTNGNNNQYEHQYHQTELNHFENQIEEQALAEMKVRFTYINFEKSKIQRSYSLDKLLKMQDDQREIHNREERNKMLANKICVKSPACLDLNLIMTKPVFYEPYKQIGMGKTLSRLLTQAPPKPEVLLKGHELRIKIECAHFRIKLLLQERDRIKQSNKKLITKRDKLNDDNTEMETLTWNRLRTLNRENLRLYEEKLSLQREVFTNVKLALLETKRLLLKELNEIYHVKKCDRIFTINGIHLPDAESYNESLSTPVEISIALGYVAHAVIIIAKIINVPLRNPIIHEGSRSKIVDNIKVLSPSDRIFPLFCRITPPPNVLLYGVYLLNQNISQIKFMLGMHRGDLRATLANLWDLMNGINAELYSRRFVEDVKPADNSASSMDSVPINVPLSISSMNRRKSRSLEDFGNSLEDFRENINSSAPDLINSRIEKE